MNIRESELPGIGYKYEIITKDREKIALVVHDDGRREIYHFDEEHEECVSNITFSDSEARQLAAILGGMVYQPKALESIEVALNDLVIEWFKIEKDSPSAAKTIGEIEIRQKYGVNVIAVIKKNGQKVLNPGSDEILEIGDTIVISGERKEIRELIKKISNR
ncbi:cation:proton antiporter regulatory subunit [Metabacillus arenae]|uniref:Cation:proton antiporter regulatory subunit n=1 Tax=Metabacillus arenae TaxID=2771434 RepID=A0A926RYC3_9BACI|nr:cation:proton antiporter regulatory subunit [Metabacillus arenae]MBD1381047.1 cation:proton antiporter regulatory subunit [Metabacillus arenae]